MRRRDAIRRLEEERVDPGWSFGVWRLPWLQIALCLAVALPDLPVILAGLVVVLLVRIPLARGPVRHHRWWSWIVLFACGLWWIREALSQPAGAGAHEFARIAAWCLVLLACVQILSLGRGGSRVLVAWCTLGATWLLAGRGWNGSAFVVVQGLVAIESLRAAEGRSWNRPSVWVRWVSILLLAIAIVAGQRAWRPGQGMWGRSAWKEPVVRVKGFSVVSRLGSFGPSYRPDRERQVAVRVWTPQPPPLLKGMVHDLYSHGSWVATRRAPFKSEERMALDFSQFCRDVSDGAPPRAWATSPDDRLPVLFAPAGTGCVGTVADSLRVSDGGVFHAPSHGAARGWTWFAPDRLDTATAPTDLRVPRDLEGLLDSAWVEIGGDVVGESARGAEARVNRLSRWFDRRFGYDLDVPQESELDPLRTFLRVRRGHCEYFASLSVLLLRRSGIPARYATGFSDPEAGSDGRSWVYRQGGAHAWVEWKPPDGNWQAFDPTPAGEAAPRPEGGVAGVTEFVKGWLAYSLHVVRDGTWRAGLDPWQERLDSLSDRTWRVMGAFALLVGGIRFLWTSKGRRSARGWEGILEECEAKLRRQGQVRGPGETVGDFLARLPATADAKACQALERYQRDRWKP